MGDTSVWKSLSEIIKASLGDDINQEEIESKKSDMGRIVASPIPRHKADAQDSVTKDWIGCIQWNGENFEDIEKLVKNNLSGYVYRLEDDLIIEYNDGYSIKRVKALDWILVIDEDSDLAVVSDKMLNVLTKNCKDYVDFSSSEPESPSKKEEVRAQEEVSDTGVDLDINNQYGDKVKLFSGKAKTSLAFNSYHGDKLEIFSFAGTKNININMRDRYGNVLKVDGVKLETFTKLSKTSADLYAKVFQLIDNVKNISSKAFDKVEGLAKRSQEIST